MSTSSSKRRARPPPPPLSTLPPVASSSTSVWPILDPSGQPPRSGESRHVEPTPYTDLVPIHEQHDPVKKSHMAPRSPGHTKRPPNSWILYRSDTLKNISRAKAQGREFIVPAAVRAHPRWEELGEGGQGMPKAQSKASKLISLMWSLETREVREEFERLSELRKVEHARQFPGYKFQPRRSGASLAGPTSPPKRSAPSRPSSASTTARRSVPHRSSTTGGSSIRDSRSMPSHPPFAFFDAPLTPAQQVALSGPVRSEKHAKASAKRKSKKKRMSASELQPWTGHPTEAVSGGSAEVGKARGRFDGLLCDEESSYTHEPCSSTTAYLPLQHHDSYSTAPTQDISWAIPPLAGAPVDEWEAYHAPSLRLGSGYELGLGLGMGGWDGMDDGHEQGSDGGGAGGDWRIDGQAHAPWGPSFQRHPEAGQRDYESPALTCDSFDSHPTPSSAYTPSLTPSEHTVDHQLDAAALTTSEVPIVGGFDIQYYEYGDDADGGFTEAWPNPLGACVGPAELIRRQYLDGVPAGPAVYTARPQEGLGEWEQALDNARQQLPAETSYAAVDDWTTDLHQLPTLPSTARLIPTNGALSPSHLIGSLPATTSALVSSSLPSYGDQRSSYSAAAEGGAGGADDDANALAAMWCLLDDSTSSISPFTLDPPLARSASSSYSTAGQPPTAHASSSTSAAATGDAEVDPTWEFALGLGGEWGIDTFDPPDDGGLAAAAATTAAAGVDAHWQSTLTSPVDDGAEWDLEEPSEGWTADKPVEQGQPMTPPPATTHLWSTSFSPAPHRSSSTAEDPIPRSSVSASDASTEGEEPLDAVTQSVARVSVGVPRRNTRVVGRSFRPGAGSRG